MTTSRTLIALFAVAAVSAPSVADTIYLTDGTTQDDVTIIDETMIHIVYRAKGKSTESNIEPDKVLSVTYSKKPRLIDEADVAAEEGQLEYARETYELWLDGVLSGENKKDRQKWAPAYAMRRIMDIYASSARHAAVATAADKLIKERPDSRHVPYAYLAKAEAQRWGGKAASVPKTIDAFKNLIDDKGLSSRWRLEADLALVLADTTKVGLQKRDRLIEIGGEAGGKYPIVRNRARVAEGETYLEGNAKDFASARKVFQAIADDPKADDATLAGAYTGLGDCLFQEAVDSLKSGGDASDTLRESLLNYLRVVVVYKDQSRYAGKAMFYAGRVFDVVESDTSKVAAKKMYRSVIAVYPTTNWAAEAKKYL
jgi:hypothetical protein